MRLRKGARKPNIGAQIFMPKPGSSRTPKSGTKKHWIRTICLPGKNYKILPMAPPKKNIELIDAKPVAPIRVITRMGTVPPAVHGGVHKMNFARGHKP
ncbi:MAG: hypothetical protein COA69_10945 [Robiginitomaculum sp.]|nr:MAG: hypothetical protein COA69_10945 [Robiginitomaculum sp.]